MNITDSGAFKPGVAVTDASGRAVTIDSKLFVDPKTKSATFQVRLTSEPAGNVTANVSASPNGAIDVGGVPTNMLLTFTPANWDRPQNVRPFQVIGDGATTISSTGPFGVTYAPTASFPFTLTPPADARVEEGNPIDVAALKPTVNLTTIRNVNEDEDQPALVGVLLNTPALSGGLDVSYVVAASSTATAGVDFQTLSGMVHVEEGLLRAELPIFPIDDLFDEGTSESLTITLSPQSSYLSGSQNQAVVTIVDDDEARILAANPSFVGVSTPKNLTRPSSNFVFDEGSNRYAFGADTKPIGTVGTYDVPRWTFTGGLAAALSGATASAVLGGDVGEGLDLDGNIIYAVNARGPGNLRVRDALFIDDVASRPNVTITAPNEILNWQNPKYDSTTNDNNLEVVMQSIRWANNPGTVNIDLRNPTVGAPYKLQLLFHENNANRGFDIFAEGNLIFNDFSAGRVSSAGQGAVVTYTFAAGDPTLNVVLNGAATPFGDKNPILQGVTLELLPAQEEPPVQEVRLIVRADTNLVLNSSQTEYVADVPVDASDADAARAAAQGTDFSGRVLLNGFDGYSLPLAPDKQDKDPSDPANLDPARTVASLTIFDDDVPGVRIVELGEHTTVAEGTQAAFQVLLTAEPKQDVTITLTPGGEIELVNPVIPGTGSFNAVRYTLGTAGVPDHVDLTLVSVNATDQGFTAVFDARLTRVTYGTAERTSTLSLSGSGGGSASAKFEIPGAGDLDFAGNPETGTWNTVQRLVVGRLTKTSNGSLQLTLNLDGASSSITLTPSNVTGSATTTTLTFKPSEWFKLQTVTIFARNDAIAEPGE